MDLKERCKKMIQEMSITVTGFCRNINLSTRSYYDWMNDKVELSSKRLKSIENYLERYGF